ncbi:transposase, partial [Synergistes jonesii]|uniref:transposase n=1 Tax=Synergistes jonesii TaxID=2754 RepID=UPI003CD0C673
QLINAILYVTENGCKWRALPKSYGNWHTIYVRNFLRLKRFRKIFTRYDKLDVLFCGFIYFAMIVDAILM